MTHNKQNTEYVPPSKTIEKNDLNRLKELSIKLRRWHERLCGDNYGVVWENSNGKCYYVSYSGGRRCINNLGKKLKSEIIKIMSKYEHLVFYIQGDPRGPALYLIHKNEVDSTLPLASQYYKGQPIT